MSINKVSTSPVAAPKINHIDDAAALIQVAKGFAKVALVEPAGEQGLSVEKDGLKVVVGDALLSTAKRGVALALSAGTFVLAGVTGVVALCDSNTYNS
jgi:hypothetical protein